jgi:hypothetical protein
MRKALEIGGFVAAAVLIAFGVVAIVMGVNGRNTVNNSLSHEYITASTDMTPSAIKAEAKKDGIYSAVKDWPTMSLVKTVNGKPVGVAIDNGAKARQMAMYMHIHSLAATQGYTYAQMGIWAAKPGTPKSGLMPGGGTDNPTFAAIDPTTKQPVSNPARQVWITYNALGTALNTSFMASQIALFGIVVGIALLLTGIGFAILAGLGALRNPETVLSFAKKPKIEKTPAVPVA